MVWPFAEARTIVDPGKARRELIGNWGREPDLDNKEEIQINNINNEINDWTEKIRDSRDKLELMHYIRQMRHDRGQI